MYLCKVMENIFGVKSSSSQTGNGNKDGIFSRVFATFDRFRHIFIAFIGFLLFNDERNKDNDSIDTGSIEHRLSKFPLNASSTNGKYHNDNSLAEDESFDDTVQYDNFLPGHLLGSSLTIDEKENTDLDYFEDTDSSERYKNPDSKHNCCTEFPEEDVPTINCDFQKSDHNTIENSARPYQEDVENKSPFSASSSEYEFSCPSNNCADAEPSTCSNNHDQAYFSDRYDDFEQTQENLQDYFKLQTLFQLWDYFNPDTIERSVPDTDHVPLYRRNKADTITSSSHDSGDSDSGTSSLCSDESGFSSDHFSELPTKCFAHNESSMEQLDYILNYQYDEVFGKQENEHDRVPLYQRSGICSDSPLSCAGDASNNLETVMETDEPDCPEYAYSEEIHPVTGSGYFGINIQNPKFVFEDHLYTELNIVFESPAIPTSFNGDNFWSGPQNNNPFCSYKADFNFDEFVDVGQNQFDESPKPITKKPLSVPTYWDPLVSYGNTFDYEISTKQMMNLGTADRNH